ncbi:hypothetical protein [Labilibaculum euxinus]
MVKNIFFIHRFHFNKSYYENDDFQILKDKGYNVKYIDMVGLLKSSKLEDTCPTELKKDIIYINTKLEFKQFLLKNKHDSIIATCVGLQNNSAWFYRIISKAGVPYIFLDVNFFPKLSSQSKIKSASTQIKRYFEKISPLYLVGKLFKSFDLYYTSVTLKPALAVLHVKTPIRKRVLKVCDENTNIIKTNSNDWNTAKREERKPVNSDKYLVFIDQYIPYHPDYIARGINLDFTPETYYNELNSALRCIGEKTGLEVHIAAHPRRMNNDDFEFPVHYNITSSLVKYSSLVVAHYSTAINFVAIHNKPVVFLTSALFKGNCISTYILDMANTFGCKPLDAALSSLRNESADRLLSIDTEAYDRYFKDNFNSESCNASCLGEIIHQLLKESE